VELLECVHLLKSLLQQFQAGLIEEYPELPDENRRYFAQLVYMVPINSTLETQNSNQQLETQFTENEVKILKELIQSEEDIQILKSLIAEKKQVDNTHEDIQVNNNK
jgi:hypothetical protein